MPVGRAHGPVLRGRWPVDVLHPGRCFLHGCAKAFNIHRDRRVAPQILTEAHKLSDSPERHFLPASG